MAKAVADTNEDNQGGFATDSSSVTGFSHMHDSGTGGVSRDLPTPADPRIGSKKRMRNTCINTIFSYMHFIFL